MKSQLLAVFGHYDSRGGTTGMPLKEATPEAVREAMRAYDRDVFGIEETGDEITTTAYGMEARECDKIVHSLIHGDSRPSAEDFLYVAELHYPDDADLEGDLEEPSSMRQYRRVLKSGGKNEERVSQDSYWPDLATVHHKKKIGNDEFEWDMPVLESLIEESCKKPIQLELAVLPADFRKAKQARIGQLELEADAVRVRIGTNYKAKTGYWDDPEYKKISEELGNLEDRLRAEQERAVCKVAKIIPNPSTTRWDDDAFGFIIGT